MGKTFEFSKFLNLTKEIDRNDVQMNYKLIHGAIFSRHRLKMCKIIDSDACLLCEKETETLEHLFFYCETVRQVWKFAESIVTKMLGRKTTIINAKEKINTSGPCNRNIAAIIAKVNKIIWYQRHLVSLTGCKKTSSDIKRAFQYSLNWFIQDDYKLMFMAYLTK